MQVSILYFEGCPNHPPVVGMVRRLLLEHHLEARIMEVEVAPGDEARLRFLGSPTVQVDGVDIEPAARERTDYAMSCRVYGSPDGLPSEAVLLAALGVEAAGSRASGLDRSALLATGGSVLTAVLSSACCWLPLLLLAFGLSAAGVSAFFERWRPLLTAVALVMLGFGFYLVYFRRSKCAGDACGGGACGPRGGNRGVFTQVMLWVSAALVGAFVLFPRYAGVVVRAADAGAGALLSGTAPAARQFRIEGMTCEVCATTLEAELRRLPGVSHASVDYATGTAETQGDDGSVEARVIEAVARRGWRATPR